LLYSFFLALAVPFSLGAVALAVFMISGEAIGGAIRAILAAGLGVWTIYLIRRAMLAPVPTLFDTKEFPHPQVQLTEVKVRAEKNVEQECVRALGAFLTEIIRLSGQCLTRGGGAYKARLKLEMIAGQRTVTLSYEGKPSETALSDLFNEIERLPTFQTPNTPISIELWFHVDT
jgi:hypothetical protein